MDTPQKPAIRKPHPPTVGTPKLGRGIQHAEYSFESSSVHQSGSKVLQSRMDGLDEQVIKRKTELAELLKSTSKKRSKKNDVRTFILSCLILLF